MWNCVMEHYTHYSAKDLKEIITVLMNILSRVASAETSSNKLNVSNNWKVYILHFSTIDFYHNQREFVLNYFIYTYFLGCSE